MDEKDQISEEFTLEDIMKEFGDHSEPQSEEKDTPASDAEISSSEEPAVRPSPSGEPEEDIPPSDEPVAEDSVSENSAPEDPAAKEESTQSEDQTPPTAEASKDEDSSPVSDGDTKNFDPVENAPTQGETTAAAEPFGDNWEPKYDQPMGEYVPPEPIVFRPRSQLHELKRKLVSGPERRYYALSEIGTGKLQISIFLSLLVVVLSVTSLGMHHIGMVQANRMRLLVFGELFAMVFSALLASGRLVDGAGSMFRGKFTLDSLLFMSFLVCLADGYFCLKEIRVPFCAAFSLEVTMSLWAELHRRNTELAEMDTLRKANRLNRVAKAPDCYEGRPGFYVTKGEPEDFMDTYRQRFGTDKLLSAYAFAAFLASTAIAVVTGLAQGVSGAMQVWSAAILASAPIGIFICQTRPMAILERRLHKAGAVLCGWQGIKAAAGASAIPLTDWDLFPAGTVKINGVKFYSNREPDQIITCTASLMNRSGNCLSPLFEQLMEDHSGDFLEISGFRSYENGGIGGSVNGEGILIGTSEFLKEMGVDVPDGTRINQAVYMAIDGNLTAVYALAFGKLRSVAAGLGSLCSYRGLTPVLVSDNFLLSQNFVRAKFGVNIRRFAFPTLEERQKLAQWNPNPEESTPCALTTQDGLAATGFSITGARNLRTACVLGCLLHILGGVLGLLIVLALTFVDGSSLLTPLNLLLFELVWLVPGLLITEWTRSL